MSQRQQTSTRGQARAGVIFDLDGTLADTLADITASVNAVFAARGLAPAGRDTVRPLISEGARTMLRRLSGIEDGASLEELVIAYRAQYAQHMLDATRLYPGWPAALNTLARRGTPMAVLSNKPHEATVLMCERLLREWPFVEFAGLTAAAPGKPDPTRARQIARRMGCKPREVRFVGDSPIDVQTARNAGMIAIGVAWGSHDPAELRAAGAVVILDQPGGLLAALSEPQA